MSELKSKISNLFKTRRVNVLLGFILLSFVILLLTKLAKQYTKTVVYSIETKNLSDDIVILNDSTNTLKVTLETFGFDWLRRAFTNKNLAIDFKEDVTKTDSVFVWSKAKGFSNINAQFSKDIRILSVTPDTLYFKYDVNAVKYVPIQHNAKINFLSGYNSLQPIVLKPDSLKIIGPDTVISKIEVIETKAIIFEDVKQDINNAIGFKLDNIDATVTIVPNEVNIISEVKKFTEGTLEIPVEVINIPRGVRIKHFPKKINVSYKTSLENYKSILESDFKVVCDYSKINNEIDYLTPKVITFPSTVKDVRLHQQKIEFILTK